MTGDNVTIIAGFVQGVNGPQDHGPRDQISYDCSIVWPDGTRTLEYGMIPTNHRYASTDIIPYSRGCTFLGAVVDGRIQPTMHELPYVEECPGVGGVMAQQQRDLLTLILSLPREMKAQIAIVLNGALQ